MGCSSLGPAPPAARTYTIADHAIADDHRARETPAAGAAGTVSGSCAAVADPVALAVLASFFFGLGVQVTRLGLETTDTRTAAVIQIGTATAVYWLAAPLFVERGYWLSPAVALFAAIGVFRPALSANLALAGTRLLGPTVSSTLSSTAPLFGVTFGVAFLGEPLTAPVLAGSAAIAGGVMLLSRRDGAGPLRFPWWALLLPVGAAVVRTLAQLLAKVGMETLPSPFFVGLVGYTVSFAVALAASRAGSGAPRPVLTPGFKWLVLTGLCYGAAILSLNTALLCGRLTVVSPIVACAPVFTLALGALAFRERHLDRRVVAAVALVVPGVVAVSVGG